MFLRKLINGHRGLPIHRLAPADIIPITSFWPRFQSISSDISLDDGKVSTYLENLKKEFYEQRANHDASFSRMTKLSALVSSLETRGVLQKNMESLGDMDSEKDTDMKELIKEERQVYSDLLKKTEMELKSQMLTLADVENCSSLMLEISAGVGGQEAMLFANELYGMYCSFMDRKGWEYEILEEDKTEIGGIRHANIIVYSKAAYNFLKEEGGVHRVQRVPETEKGGRIHTSTATVAVIPRPDDIDIQLHDKDLKLETKRASGAGGQHVNTTDSAVRIVHLPSGLSVECQSERSQIKNKDIAMKKLQAKLYERELEAQQQSTNASRKSQRGNCNRNEKIRTYNFVQDRITDHRLQSGTLHNLKDFLAGGDGLISMNQQLVEENRRKELFELIELTEIEKKDEN